MIRFNADEIFEMAEQIERNGARFYRKAAESAEGASRDLLVRLAAMEDDHEKTFAAMRAELAEAETRPLTFDPNDEAARYLQAMADGEVFSVDPSASLSGREPLGDILSTALGLEKDSIVFYQSMKVMVPEKAGKEKIEAIIKQEIGHVLDLTEQLRGLDT